MTDTDREAFEAWASDGYQWPLSIEPSGDNYKHMHTAIKWAAWQAATQRQQSRIAYVEKVADDAIELGNQQAKRIAELEAEVQALRKDAQRYRKIRTLVYIDLERKILRISDTYLLRKDGPTVAEQLDAAIDAAMNKEGARE